MQKPAAFARPTTKAELMEDYRLDFWYNCIPKPGDTERFKWSPGAIIGTLPSVIATGAGVEGPSRTLSPQRPVLPMVAALRRAVTGR